MKSKISVVFMLLVVSISLMATACCRKTSPVSAEPPTATPTVVTSSGPTTIVLNSEPAQNRVYFDMNNVAPAADANGNNWSQAAYATNSQWTPAMAVTNIPAEWATSCGPQWISSLPSGLPPTMANTYYRNSFTLPANFAILNSNLTFSVDDGVQIWLNGTEVDYYPGSLTSPDATRNYHICNTVTIPANLFQGGTNVLAFCVENLMTYEGINYSMYLTFSTK